MDRKPDEFSLTTSRRGFLALAGGVTVSGFFPVTSNATSDVTHGIRSERKIALTFHGAGDLKYTDSLLRTFAEKSTFVTVFAVGSWLKSNLKIAKEILGAGHVLGNHTLNHLPMRKLGISTIKSEIEGCAKVLQEQTGSIGSFFRPSGTQFANPSIRSVASALGYTRCISYDVDSRDYQDPGAKKVIRNVMSTLKPGSIVSLHFGHQSTVKAMPDLIDEIRQAGFTPVTLTSLLGTP